MSILDGVKEIVAEVLDIEEDEIKEESYLIRELDAESVDFLEMALSFSEKFGFEVKDDHIFLRNFQEYMLEAKEKDLNTAEFLNGKYAFLSIERLNEMLEEIKSGNIIKIKDLVSYIDFYTSR